MGKWQMIECATGSIMRQGTKFTPLKENEEVKGAYSELKKDPRKRFQLATI
jgi:hypothetical protein